MIYHFVSLDIKHFSDAHDRKHFSSDIVDILPFYGLNILKLDRDGLRDRCYWDAKLLVSDSSRSVLLLIARVIGSVRVKCCPFILFCRNLYKATEGREFFLYNIQADTPAGNFTHDIFCAETGVKIKSINLLFFHLCHRAQSILSFIAFFLTFSISMPLPSSVTSITT